MEVAHHVNRCNFLACLALAVSACGGSELTYREGDLEGAQDDTVGTFLNIDKRVEGDSVHQENATQFIKYFEFALEAEARVQVTRSRALGKSLYCGVVSLPRIDVVQHDTKEKVTFEGEGKSAVLPRGRYLGRYAVTTERPCRVLGSFRVETSP